MGFFFVCDGGEGRAWSGVIGERVERRATGWREVVCMFEGCEREEL